MKDNAKKNSRPYKRLTEEVKMVTLDVWGYRFTMAEKAVPFWWRDKIIKE